MKEEKKEILESLIDRLYISDYAEKKKDSYRNRNYDEKELEKKISEYEQKLRSVIEYDLNLPVSPPAVWESRQNR